MSASPESPYEYLHDLQCLESLSDDEDDDQLQIYELRSSGIEKWNTREFDGYCDDFCQEPSLFVDEDSFETLSANSSPYHEVPDEANNFFSALNEDDTETSSTDPCPLIENNNDTFSNYSAEDNIEADNRSIASNFDSVSAEWPQSDTNPEEIEFVRNLNSCTADHVVPNDVDFEE